MISRLLASAACLLLGCATAGRDNPAASDGPATTDATTDSEVLPPDSNNCVAQPCDILTACGCPAGETCDIDFSDVMGTACRPITSPAAAEGDACGAAKSCDAGGVCLGTPGLCRTYCDANTDCGSPRGQCLITITDGTNPIAGIPKVCTSNCDPTNVALGGCPAAQKCSLFVLDVGGVNTNLVDCDTIVTAGAPGASCTTNGAGDDSKCAKDVLCVTQGTTNTCRKACVVGGNQCGAGTCQAFGTPFVVGGINYGFCP